MALNLGELMRKSVRKHGELPAFLIKRGYRTERFSFARVEDLSLRCARFLQDKGIEKGDRVLFWSPNMPEYAVGYFACWLIGAIVVPLDVRTSPETLGQFLESSQPKLAFSSTEQAGTLRGLVPEVVLLENLADLFQTTGLPAALPEVAPNDIAEIAYTAGTTGVPKGVILTHGNLLYEINALNRVFPLDSSYTALSLLPLSHAFAQVIDLWLAFTGGTEMVFPSKLSSGAIMATMARHGVTCVSVVPEMLRLWVETIEKRVQERGREGWWKRAQGLAPKLPFAVRRVLFRDVLNALGGKLLFFGCGSAPLDLKAATVWENMGVRVLEGYGATETTAVLTLNTFNDRRLGSVGRVLPGSRVDIRENGEIWAKGPNISPGYFNNPEATATAFVDGWHRTGDVGHFEEGHLYITGREAFRIILPNGQNVYPEDVERRLDHHPLVKESCVIGVRRPEGERVHAVIVTDKPEIVSDIVRETNEKLEAHQQIMEYSLWPEPGLPRTPMLKLDRKKIAEEVAAREKPAAAKKTSEPTEAGDGLLDILAEVSERPMAGIGEGDTLGTDLELDSLSLVELVAAIEERFGVTIDDRQVIASTQVAELRQIIDSSKPAGEAEVEPSGLQLSKPVALIRRLLRNLILFPFQDYYFAVDIRHKERLERIPTPAIFVFNYQAPYAGLLVERILPQEIREKTAIAVDARIWEGVKRWQGLLATLFANAFPFSRADGPVRASLQRMGGMLDRGVSVIISPEGWPEMGEKFLPFHAGVGLMAVEMRVPVVPFRIDHYYRLFAPDAKFPWLPNKRGKVIVTVGEPLFFPRGMSYDEATVQIRKALAALGVEAGGEQKAA